MTGWSKNFDGHLVIWRNQDGQIVVLFTGQDSIREIWTMRRQSDTKQDTVTF